MLKQLSDISVGDWVLTESLVQDRHVGNPWKVTALAKSRVYLCQYREDPLNKGVHEVSSEKYVQMRSIRYVLADEKQAEELSALARTLGEECQAAIRKAQADCLAKFLARVATLSPKA